MTSEINEDVITIKTNSLEPIENDNLKHKRFLVAARGIFNEYISNSTIHGFAYIGERERPLIEKIWWLIAIFISIYSCGNLIWNVWNKWEESPVIVSFAEKSTPVWQIPFPAVTICPETKARNKCFDFTKVARKLRNNENVTHDELFLMGSLSQVCLTYMIEFPPKTPSLSSKGQTCDEIIPLIAPEFDDVLLSCIWRENRTRCDYYFTEILTEEGLCFTFNMLDSDEIFTDENANKKKTNNKKKTKTTHWSLENGYSNEALVQKAYPRRVIGVGTKTGLEILLNLYSFDLDYLCRGPVQGFKVVLHTPAEMPPVSKNYFRLPLNKEVVISIKPGMMITSEELRDYSPQRRLCFFNADRQLRFFKSYTKQNCESECLSNYTFLACGCVKFSMPRTNDTPICSPHSIQCYINAENELLIEDVKNKLTTTDTKSKCNCLPACTEIVYDAEVSQADLDWKKYFLATDEIFQTIPGLQIARVQIFFKVDEFIATKRSELFGLTDLIANCGGLLGLCLGISLLSIVEIIYFCTIRLITNLWKKKIRPILPVKHIQTIQEKTLEKIDRF